MIATAGTERYSNESAAPGTPGGVRPRSSARSGLLVVVFFAALAFVHALPISDPDFFWHLATGRWLWEHERFPEADPFSFTTPADVYQGHSLAKVMSRQYWLANLLQYGVWHAAGYPGVVGMRVLLALLTLFVVYRGLRAQGLSVISALLLLAPLGHVVASYQGDRPNQMTFFFLAASLTLIEDLKRRPGGPARACLLPVLMLFWANVHGGFILGAASAGIYLLSELSRALVDGWSRVNRTLCAVLTATILAGFLNPNGYAVIPALFSESFSVQGSVITELMSPLEFTRLGTDRYLVQLCAYVALAATSVVVRVSREGARERAGARSPLVPLVNRVDQLLLILVFGSLSFHAVRIIPLLAIVCTPIAGGLLSGRPDLAVQRLSKYLLPEAVLVSLVAAAAWSAYPSTLARRPLVEGFFPEPAVQFVKSSPVERRMLNYYDWGGYLIWRFYPEAAVFIDGRGSSPRISNQYLAVSGGDRSVVAGRFAYQAVLDAHAVNTILIPAIARNGGLLPLIWLLERNPEWKLVFAAKNCLLYARDTPLVGLPKITAYAIARKGPFPALGDDPRPYLAIARSELGLGRWDDATAFLADALRQRPSLRGGAVERGLAMIRGGRDILREDTGLP